VSVFRPKSEWWVVFVVGLTAWLAGAHRLSRRISEDVRLFGAARFAAAIILSSPVFFKNFMFTHRLSMCWDASRR